MANLCSACVVALHRGSLRCPVKFPIFPTMSARSRATIFERLAAGRVVLHVPVYESGTGTTVGSVPTYKAGEYGEALSH